MRKNSMVTSISLPEGLVAVWRENRRSILDFGDRYLRLIMRGKIRRETTRTYNRSSQPFRVVHVRFSPAEYDALHCAGAALRVSVSLIVCGIIRLWLKPHRRAQGVRYRANYCMDEVVWNPEAGIYEESLTFWRITPENPTGRPVTLPGGSSG
ncbi:MAG: hypothetical protein OHK0011_19000 [Turneriella sp.]